MNVLLLLFSFFDRCMKMFMDKRREAVVVIAIVIAKCAHNVLDSCSSNFFLTPEVEYQVIFSGTKLYGA